MVVVKVPLYPAAFFQGEIDGEGMNVVLYFKLSDGYSKELSSQFQDNMRVIINSLHMYNIIDISSHLLLIYSFFPL